MLDLPFCDEQSEMTAHLIGTRSRTLLRAVRTVCDADLAPAAGALIRPLVEGNLLLRFLLDDPVVRCELWAAETERMKLTIDDGIRALPKPVRSRWKHVLLSQEERVRLKRVVAHARAVAIRHQMPSISDKGQVLPGVENQLHLLNDIGARESYEVAYRLLNADAHVGEATFDSDLFNRRADGGYYFSDRVTTEQTIPYRTLALCTFASTLVIVSEHCNLGVSQAADVIKCRLVPHETPLKQRRAANAARPS